jgi:hypothetical protein
MSAETHRGTSQAPGTGDAVGQAQGEPGMSAEGFFRAEGDTLVPAPFATSPWGQVLHGRLLGGLTARAAEQARAEVPELACARLTVDLFRSVPLEPVRVTVSPVRTGRRIVVLDVTVEQDGVPVGQGRAVLLRRSQQPDGTFRRFLPGPRRRRRRRSWDRRGQCRAAGGPRPGSHGPSAARTAADCPTGSGSGTSTRSSRASG